MLKHLIYEVVNQNTERQDEDEIQIVLFMDYDFFDIDIMKLISQFQTVVKQIYIGKDEKTYKYEFLKKKLSC